MLNLRDNCWKYENPEQADLDRDDVGDVCDPDLDGDWDLNDEDNCPQHYNVRQDDLDGDGLGDVCDDDIDEDGVENGLFDLESLIPDQQHRRNKRPRNAGETAEEDESTTKFSSVTINLTSEIYNFTESADPDDNNLKAALPDTESSVNINGNGAILQRDPNATESFEGGALRTRAETRAQVNRCTFLNNSGSAPQAMGGLSLIGGIWWSVLGPGFRQRG